MPKEWPFSRHDASQRFWFLIPNLEGFFLVSNISLPMHWLFFVNHWKIFSEVGLNALPIQCVKSIQCVQPCLEGFQDCFVRPLFPPPDVNWISVRPKLNDFYPPLGSRNQNHKSVPLACRLEAANHKWMDGDQLQKFLPATSECKQTIVTLRRVVEWREMKQVPAKRDSLNVSSWEFFS